MSRNPETSESESYSVPVKTVLEPPTFTARTVSASVLVAVLGIWAKLTFISENEFPGGSNEPMHGYLVPLGFNIFYLASLPVLRELTKRYLDDNVDLKQLLREAMIIYNAVQVLVNGWMVYRMVDAVLFRGHPFIGASPSLVDSGASYAVWVHYCNKYLEFFDTFFMVLRGRMDQVSFLHVYHHCSISWAWWIGLTFYGGGDIYFGGLLNSLIHVMMYSYYLLSLLKVNCPWKKYLTQAQLLQFCTVVGYTCVCWYLLPPELPWTYHIGPLAQIFEMASLLFLFLHFYRKTYDSSKNKRKISKVPAADHVSLSSDNSEETQ